MKTRNRVRGSSVLTYFLLIVGSLFIILPFYLTIVTALKSDADIANNFFGLPTQIYLENFKKILFNSSYLVTVLNTLYITILALFGIFFLIPMTAYPIARSLKTSGFYRGLYYFFLVGLFIPFQVKMMPLMKLVKAFGMMNQTGLAILYIISATCEGVFLFVGYIASLPYEVEEAATIDGASTFTTYRKIIVPLLKPIIATVMIRDGLWIWNDFMMPLLVLNRSSAQWTVTLFQYNFKSEYSIDYSMVFATCVMSMLPIIVFYMFMQKNIISGLTSGAVKD